MSDSPITPATRFESYMADIVGNLDQIAQNMAPEGSGEENPGGLELYKLKPSTRFESYMADISGKLEEIAQNVTPGGGGGGGDGLPTTGGTMSGAINMDGNAITNLPQASASGDAVSYGQVAQMLTEEEEITTWSETNYYIKNNGTTVDFDNPTYVRTVDARYLVTQCAPGDTFRITATGGSSYRPYSFQDASSNVLVVAPSGTIMDDTIVTAPMGSATLLVNDTTMAGSVYKGKYYDPNMFAMSNKYYLGLASGTDLDNVTQPGNYLSGGSGITDTLIHCPVTGTGFILKNIETTTAGSSTRFFQLLVTNHPDPEIWIRANSGAWGQWLALTQKDATITTTNLILTSSNYLTYFPNGSFNDAPLNSIVTISANVPLTNGPDGDSWIGYSTHTSTGYIRGTLLTFRAHETSASVYSGVVQMLIGYRATDYSPTLSYRTAIAGDNGLDWSAWSKFEQNGYLHSGNRIISAGRMSESVSDLDNMEQNAIYQIDLNCTGETPESTLGHHPFPGVSCVVVDMAFSYSTPHGRVQTVYALDGRVAWRYGYKNDVDDYRWTAWRLYATDIPAAPTTDGTYRLQCTVSNGAATYAWVSAT